MRPEDLLRLREDIQFETSSASVGERNIELGTGFLKNEEKCFDTFRSNRSKILIEGV